MLIFRLKYLLVDKLKSLNNTSFALHMISESKITKHLNKKGEKLHSLGRQDFLLHYEMGGLMECPGVSSRCQELQQR
jgi:hypothetical protein